MLGCDSLNDLNEKMRILYLSNKPIYPVVDGGCKAMQQFLSCLLENNFDVKHVCLATKKHPFDLEAYPEELQDRIHPQAFTIDTRIKPFLAFTHLISRKSYNIARFNHQKVHKGLKDILTKHTFDVVVLDSLYTSTYLETIRANSQAKIVLRTHNVEYTIWEQLAINATKKWKKWYYNRLAEDLKIYEKIALSKVDLIATLSQDDEESIKNLEIKTPMVTIPVAMSEAQDLPEYAENDLFFLGAMNWKPNQEAATWLSSEIFPLIHKKNPSIQLHFAGSFLNVPPNQADNAPIYIHGFVAESEIFMQTHGILVLPIKSGSGVRIKLLEAMNLGVPIVTTSAGAQGITDLSSLKIANTTEEFTKAIQQFITSQTTRMEYGLKAKAYIRANYSVEAIAQQIKNEFGKL
jgi:glycosyltransferase involved in cell wall biosynthesis